MPQQKPTPFGQSDNDLRLLKYRWLTSILSKKRLTMPMILSMGGNLLYGLQALGSDTATRTVSSYEMSGFDLTKPIESLMQHTMDVGSYFKMTLGSTQSYTTAITGTAQHAIPIGTLLLTLYAAHRTVTSFTTGDGRLLLEAFSDRGPYKDMMYQAKYGQKRLFDNSDFNKQPSRWALYRPAQWNNFCNRIRQDGVAVMQRLGGALIYRAATGKDYTKTFFDEPRKLEVNLFHLAALLGVDDSPVAKRLKMSEAFSDPAYQEVFKNAGDITEALAPNITNLKDFATRASKSLGDISQYIFKNPIDIDACLQEWSALTASCFITANKEIQENNMRHGVTKYVVEMQLASANGSLTVKDAQKMLKRLDAFEHIRNYDTPTAPLSDMMQQVDNLKAALTQAIPAGAKGRDKVVLPVLPGLDGQWQNLPKPLLLEQVFAEHYGPDVPFSIDHNEMFVHKFSDKLASTILKSPMMDNTPEHERQALANELRDTVLQRTAMSMSKTTIKDRAEDLVDKFRPTPTSTRMA